MTCIISDSCSATSSLAPFDAPAAPAEDPSATPSRRAVNLSLLRSFYEAQVAIALSLLRAPSTCLAWLDSQPMPREHKRIAKADKVHRGVDALTPDAAHHLRALLSAAALRSPSRHHAEEMLRYASFRVLTLGVTRDHEGVSVVTPSLLQWVAADRPGGTFEPLVRVALTLREEIVTANLNLTFSAGRSLYNRISATEKLAADMEDAVACCQQALMEAVDIWLPGRCRFPGAGSDLALSSLFNSRLKHVSDEWRTKNFAIVEPRGNHVKRSMISKEKARLLKMGGAEVSDEQAAASLVAQGAMTESKAREILMLPKVVNFTGFTESADRETQEEGSARSVEEICMDEAASAPDLMERSDRAELGMRLLHEMPPADHLVVAGLRGGDMLREAAARWIQESVRDLFEGIRSDSQSHAARGRPLAVTGVRVMQWPLRAK